MTTDMLEQPGLQPHLHKDERKKMTIVWCTLSFPALHCWKGATGTEAYLRMPHRHIFHVRAGINVNHQDRQVEFIALKNQIQEYVDEKYRNKTFELSCEMIAEDILAKFQLNEVSVSEDNENGATVYSF